MLLDSRYRIYTVEKAVGVLLNLTVTVSRVQTGTECGPVASHGIDVQRSFGMEVLAGVQQIVHEPTAQVHINFTKRAFAASESLKVLVNMFPLGVLLCGKPSEICEEVTFLLFLVEEVITLVDDALVTAAAQCLCLLSHTVVVVSLTCILRLGIDVYAEQFVTHDFHRCLVTVAGIVVQIVRQHLAVLDFACPQ